MTKYENKKQKYGRAILIACSVITSIFTILAFTFTNGYVAEPIFFYGILTIINITLLKIKEIPKTLIYLGIVLNIMCLPPGIFGLMIYLSFTN